MVKNWHKNKWTNLQKDFLTLLKSLEIVKKLPGGVGHVAHHQASCPILLLIPTLPLAFLSRLMRRQCGKRLVLLSEQTWYIFWIYFDEEAIA